MINAKISPHIHNNNKTANIMLWVIAAMIPAVIVQSFYFGFGVLIQISIALLLAIIVDIIVAKLRQKPLFYYLSDITSLVTAMMLAVAIPPYAPFWIIIIGVLTALLLGKHCYGGMGQNIFNPAMVGYALLLISFPVQMTAWSVPTELLGSFDFIDEFLLIFTGTSFDNLSIHQLVNQIDGISGATPLDSAKTLYNGLCSNCNLNSAYNNLIHSPIFINNFDIAQGWWQVNIAFLLGGIVLLYKGIIRWHIPVALLTTFMLCSLLMAFFGLNNHLSPYAQLVSGAMMYGAFFIATDPVSAPSSKKGMLIFGVLIGFLEFIIRYFGSFPDGIAFSVLLANICVPIIDYYSRPKVYGA